MGVPFAGSGDLTSRSCGAAAVDAVFFYVCVHGARSLAVGMSTVGLSAMGALPCAALSVRLRQMRAYSAS